MKYILFLLVLLICTTSPVFAQEPKIGDFLDPINPSLFTDKIEIPYHVFNTILRDAEITELENQNPGSWQLSFQNDLLYGNPNGNAVIRIYDVDITDKFLEIGMGSYPDYKYWVAAQVPETGYVLIHADNENGWIKGIETSITYSEQNGLSVNNGQRTVISNLDVSPFTIKAYSAYGMESSTDPPATTSGIFIIKIISADYGENPYSIFPFVLAGIIGLTVGILVLTKKRS